MYERLYYVKYFELTNFVRVRDVSRYVTASSRKCVTRCADFTFVMLAAYFIPDADDTFLPRLSLCFDN